MGLYCLVNDPLLHPKFSGISVIRKSSCGSGVSKVYFSKLVVIERRQFCLPIRDIWRYRERFWGVTVWGTMLLEWINTRNLLNNQCTRPSFSTRNNAAPNVNRTEIKKLCSRPIFALKKFSCILRVYKSHFEDFAGAILLFLFSTVHWHLFGSQGQTLELWKRQSATEWEKFYTKHAHLPIYSQIYQIPYIFGGIMFCLNGRY